MQETRKDIREAEAAWVKEQMNRHGMSNAEVHDRLSQAGFEGQANNVTMWITARTSIPAEWFIELIRIFSPEEESRLVPEMLSQRMPYLRPYLQIPNAVPGEAADSAKPSVDRSSLAEQNRRTPSAIYYVARVGRHKGGRFVPHKNRKGNYQGGISRFSRDIEEFESLQDLWKRLSTDSDFKVRMAPQQGSGPASLISRDSMIIEWDE